MHVPKRSPRQEYRFKQREQIEASPLIAERFPRLKAINLLLEYFDAAGITKNGEMKCKLNLQHARSKLWYACPGGECVGGDFDLTDALAKAVASGPKASTGEIRCQGKRKRGDKELVPCLTLLRYKLTLQYNGRAA